MPTLAEEEASEESDNEEESEDVFNELVDRLRKVALEAQVCLSIHCFAGSFPVNEILIFFFGFLTYHQKGYFRIGKFRYPRIFCTSKVDFDPFGEKSSALRVAVNYLKS